MTELVYANRVHEACSGTGASNLTLTGALSGKSRFTDKIQSGSLVPYVLLDGNGTDWEVGFGTLASATELQRTTVKDSSATEDRVNSGEDGTPVKISLSTNQHEVFVAPFDKTVFSRDSVGALSDPSAIRAALFVENLAAMTALAGLSDGETVITQGGAAFGDGLGGIFYWDPDDAGAESPPNSYEHDSVEGLFKRLRLDVQGLFTGGLVEVDAALADTADTGGGAFKFFFRKKATASTAWARWIADYVSSTVGRVRLGIRYAQASAEKFFIDVYSTGDNLDRIQFNEPAVLASRTNSNGLQARALAFLSGVSRLALARSDAATGAAADYNEIPLTKGGYIATVVNTLAALKAIDAAALIADGEKGITLGASALSDEGAKTWRWSASSSATADDVNVARPAVGAASSGNGRWLLVTRADSAFSTLAAAAAYKPEVAPNYIETFCHTSVAGGGGARYKKVGSEPSHAGKFSVTTLAGSTVWYELAEAVFTPRMFGALGDGTTDDTTAISAAITAAGVGGALYFPDGIYIFSSVLTQLSGQRWYGAGRAVSILRLAPSVTSIAVCVTASNFAEDYSIEDMQIDGNRANITPASDLYNTFYLVRGPRGGKRGVYRNLLLANSWGRVLQTSDESQTEYAEDILVENVWAINAGTKAISATQSTRVTIRDCFAEVDPYTSADHAGGVGDGNAASGSCFECNDANNVVISGCHGVQIGTVEAPGIRLVNTVHSVEVCGNTIDGAHYLGFIQNANDISFHHNIGRNLTGNAILVADADGESGFCRRIRIHNNTIIDADDACVFVTANNSAHVPEVEVYIYDNHFVQSAGSPTYGIYNEGVASPAVSGTCLVYEWGNRYTGTIPNQRAGPAAAQIQPEPNRGWQIIEQGSGSGAGTPVGSVTGTTAETTLKTVTVPGGRQGTKGRLRVTAHYSFVSGGAPGTRTARIRHAGSQLWASANANTIIQQRVEVESCNRNSQSAQIIGASGLTGGFGTTATVVQETTIDTSIDRDITFTVALADGGDTGKLESYRIEVYYEL